MIVSIIGSGNIAWHLTHVLEENGIRVAELSLRNKANAASITGYLYDVQIKTDLDFRQSPSSVFILAISDNGVRSVSEEIKLPPKAILVHTSGALGMNALLGTLERNPSAKLGVFYPLMTFTKGIKVDFRDVPMCIEGEDETTSKFLKKMAYSISEKVQMVNSHQRSVLHVAAVFACNFTNHLWALSKEITEEEELDFDLLKPLIQETFIKGMKAKHPAEVQTGPAIRDDHETISKHLALIRDDQDLMEVYNSVTKSIQNWHQ
ncbi:MAG: putative short-subunit dehydrogenase-like oxidoreductase (DUF2520 family) [Arcticibacterium sp.]|jgi:predicted short-subunit dehydrogenase-like oxidoreductase (DUF2520 family)